MLLGDRDRYRVQTACERNGGEIYLLALNRPMERLDRKAFPAGMRKSHEMCRLRV